MYHSGALTSSMYAYSSVLNNNIRKSLTYQCPLPKLQKWFTISQAGKSENMCCIDVMKKTCAIYIYIYANYLYIGYN